MFTQKEIREINVVVQTHPRLGNVMVGRGKFLDIPNLFKRIKEEYEALGDDGTDPKYEDYERHQALRIVTEIAKNYNKATQ